MGRFKTLFLLPWAALAAGVACASPDHGDAFRPIAGAAPKLPASLPAPREYALGPGDRVQILSEHRELAREYTLGPRGRIVMHPAGPIDLRGLSRSRAEIIINRELSRFYNGVTVSLNILKYENNRVFVLGKVLRPGIVRFHGRPTLLEALAKAGIRSAGPGESPAVTCSIIRGRDTVIRVDLDQLLRRGGGALNLALQNGDVVHVPERQEHVIHVLGQAGKPGSFPWYPGMRLVNAVAGAGGLHEDAAGETLRVVRFQDGRAAALEVDFVSLRAGRGGRNVALRPGDVVFIPRKGTATINYYLRKLNPFAQILIIGKALSGE